MVPVTEKAREDAPFSPRYPAIEKLIDSENFDRVNKGFGRAYEELEGIAKNKGLGKAQDAKKAMKGLERVMDLLAYLLRLKYEYLESQEIAAREGGEKSPRRNLGERKKSPEGKQLHR